MTATHKNKTFGAVQIPPRETSTKPPAREFLRLPPVGQRCPVTGMSRAALNALILPTPANDNKPPVKSFCLRQRGARTGIRLIDYQSLRGFILAHAERGTETGTDSELEMVLAGLKTGLDGVAETASAPTPATRAIFTNHKEQTP